MKTIKFLSMLIIASLFVFQGNIIAQGAKKENRGFRHENNEMQNCPNHQMFNQQAKEGHEMMIPNLTDDQKAKIKDLRIAHMKEILPLKNQLGELKAKQKTLTTAVNVDMKLINANIDEILAVRGKMMKAAENMHQQIRALLNDEQRVFFDLHRGEMKGKMREHFQEE